MRQAPFHYLLIGNGRVSRHFQHYFKKLFLPFDIWCRDRPTSQLLPLILRATHILILISDREIEAFIEHYLYFSEATLVHFSGSWVSQRAYGAHPLMCFNESRYDFNQYMEIPFIIDESAPSFDQLLPGLPNKAVYLDSVLKAKYHALCVLSGNFSCMLWQKLFNDFEQELHLPSSVGYAYLKQQMQNLLFNYRTALTGPLTRGDLITIENNLNALAGDPFHAVYKSFVRCYQQLKAEK